MKKTLSHTKQVAVSFCAAMIAMCPMCGINLAVAEEVPENTTEHTVQISGKGIWSHKMVLHMKPNQMGNNEQTQERLQLTASVAPSDVDITWSSSNSNVVQVNSNGQLTMNGIGKATITASAGDCSDSIEVTVDDTFKRTAKDRVALRRDGVHFLPVLAGKTLFKEVVPDYLYTYGRASVHSNNAVYMGDWDGDGIDTPAIRSTDGTFLVSNSRTGGTASVVFTYGSQSDRDEDFVVGDWNGDGKDTFAVRRNGMLYIRNSLTRGPADTCYRFVDAEGDILAGDWDGDGIDTPAIRVTKASGQYAANNVTFTDTPIGRSDESENIPTDLWGYSYGATTTQILVGDWDGDGCDSIGMRNANRITMQSNVHDGNSTFMYTQFTFGKTGERVYTGAWGSGIPQGASTVGLTTR